MNAIPYPAHDTENLDSVWVPERAPDSAPRICEDHVLVRLALDTDVDLLPDLVAGFLDDIGQQMRRIDAAVSRSDIVALELQAHALAGCASTFGAEPLHRQACRVIEMCRTGSTEAALTSATPLAGLVARVMTDMPDTVARVQATVELDPAPPSA
ncbi:Hpt domain-containing protein [Roseospira marina]|uniref:Hpt domain-containing protein n=1 Tax=Roseospira marina TaxID=140057 RepID=A0A5M6IG11_9PROT|nr:Hpt domain-containing protein [Roseospira marina]KAA5606518.1 Hpt domain-containing protein [Roseospira marina]MBB4314056.1 HPt (histidine-containing phosphotransfer) domain-containing protein [Roseospira marina]MBB5087217.1 HPt (histidine-containing phosphotransfer) domain-containing protein [Roseospira marina]